MKREVLSGIAALTLLDISAATAQAQDFTGTYLGIHGGYRWVDADLTAPAYDFNDGGDTVNVPARSETFSPDGGIIGIHIGHNARLSRKWIIGIEADIDAGFGDDSRSAGLLGSDGLTAINRSEVEANWQGTIRARLGYESGRWLLYGTAGIAFMSLDWSDSITTSNANTFTASTDDVLTGWAAGFGFDYAHDENWLLRAEYLYEDLGDMTVPLAGTTETGQLDVTAHKFRIGISYKFGRRTSLK